MDVSANGIQIEVKVYKGTEKIFIRKQCENLIKGRSIRTKSLDIDEWLELKKAAQTIDDHLYKLNLAKSPLTNHTTSLPSHSEQENVTPQRLDSTPFMFANNNEERHCIKMSKNIKLHEVDEENTKAIAELLAILHENEGMFNEQ